MFKHRTHRLMTSTLLVTTLAWKVYPVHAASHQITPSTSHHMGSMITSADRKAAAVRRTALNGLLMQTNGSMALTGMAMPGGTPDYFGFTPNYANSPLPPVVTFTGGEGTGAAAIATVQGGVITAITLLSGGHGYTSAPEVVMTSMDGSGASATATIDANGTVNQVTVTNGGSGYGGIRKFVDSLPGLGVANANNLGQYIPVALPDITTYPGADYYEIELGEYTERLHSDLPPTTLRGYKQTNTSDSSVNQFKYLGPMIIARKDRPVRIKFTNRLPTGVGGDLFLPVDTSVMGAGMGPLEMNASPMNYTQNRATLHLHGGNTPWISDGTQHQWITPAGENTPYPKGVSVYNVPDMPDPGPGAMTFYYTNQQSARLMFYHDHAYGITRLNVYAGEAAGYLLTDSAEQGLINSGIIPAEQIPLVIQDKTFVPGPNQLAAEDPTWDKGGLGQLWLPHVYMPNQNPYDMTGANAMGRWDYGAWFWPPFTGLVNGPVPNPYYDPENAPWEAPYMPGTPNPSIVPEALMDTPLVNGTIYPYLRVGQKAYRFRILNASNDRFLNLQLYFAKSNDPMWDSMTGALLNPNAGEVNMVPAIPNAGLPMSWPTDGREGGVPDPSASGPSLIQIGTEGGFLPAPVVLPNTPAGYSYDRRSATVLNITNTTLFLGPAERADIIVDFSGIPDGSKLILYNDAPAPVSLFDPRYDYYTGSPDQTDTGGAPSTLPGYGPNTRTLMQIQVAAELGSAPSFNLSALQTALPAAYAQFQDKPIVPQAAYNTAFNANYPVDAYARIYSDTLTFFNGPVMGLTLTKGGSGYTSVPAVNITGGGGTGATVGAILTPTSVANLTLSNGGSAYTSAPTVTISGGGGTGATATATLTMGKSVTKATVTNGGKGYNSAPTVSFSGGGGTGATASTTIKGGKVTAVNITNGGSNYTSPPTPVFSGGGGSGASATTSLSGGTIASLTVTNGGSGYTSVPTVSFSGGGGTGAAAIATLTPTSIATLTLKNGGNNYTSAPTINFSGGGGSGATATALGITMNLEPKAIVEDFDPIYGRMDAMLGVEVPLTGPQVQTTIPFFDIDPATEVFKNSDAATPIGSSADGTQLWKITHNGVDTHAIHWHMFSVQIINRVGWDGMIKPPDPNELGWKETVRMNPLEDMIVAMRPIIPNIPFDLPNSIRPLDVTMPLGSTMGFHNVGPDNEPAPVTNQLVNFGWEYVWHCHLLGHEENIMMRPISVGVAPKAPSNLLATVPNGPASVILTWTDNSINETDWTVQRATSAAGPWTTVASLSSTLGPATGGGVTYTDTSVVKKKTYYYRVIANNVVGYTQTYTLPSTGYPHLSADSVPSGTSNSVKP